RHAAFSSRRLRDDRPADVQGHGGHAPDPGQRHVDGGCLMAKTSGLGDNAYIDGTDLSGDTASLGSIHGGPAAIDVTGINKSAYERLGGLRDGGISWVSYFSPTGAPPKLSALPTADVVVSYFRGTAVGNPAASVNAKQVNYDPTRGQDGSYTFAV